MIQNIIGIIVIPIISILFLIYIYLNYGKLKSISDSYYKLRQDKEGYLFVCFILAVSSCFAAIGKHYLIYSAAGLLCLVAFSPAFEYEDWKTKGLNTLELGVHVFGAISAILLGFVYIIFITGLWWLIIPQIGFMTYALWKNPKYKKQRMIKNYTYWIEVVALGLIWIGFLINLLK